MSGPDPREELRATIEARRELGPGHDDALVESFLARIERRLEEQPKGGLQASSGYRARGGVAVGIVSLVVAIPLIAIGGGVGGALGVIAACLLLVVINALYWEQTK